MTKRNFFQDEAKKNRKNVALRSTREEKGNAVGTSTKMVHREGLVGSPLRRPNEKGKRLGRDKEPGETCWGRKRLNILTTKTKAKNRP